jgi:hypothetical protein
MKTIFSALVASLVFLAPAEAVTVKKTFKPGSATGYTRGGDFGTVIGPKAQSRIRNVTVGQQKAIGR